MPTPDEAIFLPHYYCRIGNVIRTDQHLEDCGWIHYAHPDPTTRGYYSRNTSDGQSVFTGEQVRDHWYGQGSQFDNFTEVNAIHERYLAGLPVYGESIYTLIMEATGGER